MNNAVKYTAYQLRDLMKDSVIASLFTDPNNPDDFIAGYVQAVNGRTTLISSITPFGRADGYFAIRLAAIMEVQYDSVYAERLSLLMKIDGESPSRLPIREEEDALAYLLRLAAEEKRAVTLWTENESYAGFVTQVNDLFVQIEPVDFIGRRCPGMSFRLADIEMVSLGSEEEQMYERLEHYYRQHGG